MLQSELTIINNLGLHARAAAKFVACCSSFGSSIRVCRDGNWIDGKSIMSVMMLAAAQGTVLSVEIDGEDEAEALAALKELVEDYFGEGE